MSGEVVAFKGDNTHDRRCTPQASMSSGGSAAAAPAAVVGVLLVIVAVIVVIFLVLRHKVSGIVEWLGGWMRADSIFPPAIVLQRKQKKNDVEADLARLRAEASIRGTADNETNQMVRQLSTKNGLSFENPLFRKAQASESGFVDFDGTEIAIADIPPWLRGRMSREQAEQGLSADSALIGDFLLRESPSDGCHVITVKVGAGQYEHHKLKRLGAQGVYAMNGEALSPACASLLDVVRHLSHTKHQNTVLLNFSALESEQGQNMYGAIQREEERFYGQFNKQQQAAVQTDILDDCFVGVVDALTRMNGCDRACPRKTTASRQTCRLGFGAPFLAAMRRFAGR
jgi:hypothetical protein